MKAIENLKRYFKSVNDRRFLEKFEDSQHFYRVGYDERVRWFEMVGPKERREALEKGWICNDGTYQRLFPKYANWVAPHMRLNDEQFALILSEGYFEALQGYIAKRTLSVSQLCSFITATIRRAGSKAPLPKSEESKRLLELLYSYIMREGLPTSLISFVLNYPDEMIGSIKQRIFECHKKHYHINAVKNGMTNCEVNQRFTTYLSNLKKEGKEMPDEAAVKMNGGQVLAFHRMGLHLSKKAIVSLLANDEHETTTDSILANEVLYPMWQELECVLEARPDTYYKYQRALVDGKLKKAVNS